MKRKERLRYYSLYTVLFAVLSFLVFFIFIKNGRSFVYESNGEDGIAQHYMSLVYLGNYLRDILHNLFINHKLIIPQWDMTLGLGADDHYHELLCAGGSAEFACSICIP